MVAAQKMGAEQGLRRRVHHGNSLIPPDNQGGNRQTVQNGGEGCMIHAVAFLPRLGDTAPALRQGRGPLTRRDATFLLICNR